MIRFRTGNQKNGPNMTKRYERLWRDGHISAAELRAINNASGEEVLSPAEIFGSKHDEAITDDIRQ